MIHNTAKKDAFTGYTGLPNAQWGYGKLDVFKLLTMPLIRGCMDTAGFNYQPTATIPDTCIPKVYGCTNPLGTNYNPLANIDDGSCYAVGTNNMNQNTQITLFPNPISTTKAYLNIAHNNPQQTNYTVIVYNNLGQQMHTKTTQNSNNQYVIDLLQLNNGQYWVVVRNGTKTIKTLPLNVTH
jgi:hypothetical protein